MMYIVTRHGIYMQGVIGVYASQDLAESAVVRAKQLEPDTYHTFEIHEINPNRDVFIGVYGRGWNEPR